MAKEDRYTPATCCRGDSLVGSVAILNGPVCRLAAERKKERKKGNMRFVFLQSTLAVVYYCID